ncbi:hypothetical protein LguiB_033229 [Lonicera macranthoides]
MVHENLLDGPATDVREAQMAYQLEKNKVFSFDHCYQILKELQRFSLTTTSSNSQHSRYGPSEETIGSSINLGDDSSPISIEGPDLNRPIGRNAAKLDKKRKGKAKLLASEMAELERSEAFNKMYEEKVASNAKANEEMRLHMSRLENFREEERQRNIREEARRNREVDLAEENALMSMDLTRMNDQQRELYNYRLQEFLNRRRHQSSQFNPGNQYL